LGLLGVLDFPASSDANYVPQKMEKKASLFEQSEFRSFPIFVVHNWEPEGRR
jgi:hypothetical protein